MTPNSRSYITQFSQPDPIIPDPYNPLDWNRYAYVRYNPINLVDPSGNKPCGLMNLEGCVGGSPINSYDNANQSGEMDNESYQDYLFSLLRKGTGPGGMWSEKDWDNYYTNRQGYWQGKLQWENSPAPGLDRFVSDTQKMADKFADSPDRFVHAFGLVFGGIPGDGSWINSAVSVRQGPHELIPLDEGTNGWNPALVDDENPSHHYAGLFYLGYHAGYTTGIIVNYLRDINDPQDIRLGNIAAIQGAFFHGMPEIDWISWMKISVSGDVSP